MTTSELTRTPYDRRVQLVQETIASRSELPVDAAKELAVHVLHALDSIPERMR